MDGLHAIGLHGVAEKRLAVLIALGAAPVVVTDPALEFPLGRPPAVLASDNGYKGISAYLAEAYLSADVASVTMNDQKLNSSPEDSILKAYRNIELSLFAIKVFYTSELSFAGHFTAFQQLVCSKTLNDSEMSPWMLKRT